MDTTDKDKIGRRFLIALYDRSGGDASKTVEEIKALLGA